MFEFRFAWFFADTFELNGSSLMTGVSW
jgi:hypothetical protein